MTALLIYLALMVTFSLGYCVIKSMPPERENS